MKKAIFAMLAMAAAVFAQSALAETVEIASAADWAAFAGRVNNGETTLNAKLTADITLTGDPVRVGLVTSGDGAVSHTYAGEFDGHGHTIILDWEARITDAVMDLDFTTRFTPFSAAIRAMIAQASAASAARWTTAPRRSASCLNRA